MEGTLYWMRPALVASLAALSLSSVPAGAATVPGTVAGTFSVAQTGAATYSVPVEVPPGTAGMQPSLSLGYDSSGGNGELGVGWSLGGLSTIHRCPRTVADDGIAGAIRFDADDRFCLDGERLQAVSGRYGAPGTVYRTRIEQFSEVRSDGSVGGGPQRWMVRTRAGQTFYYGYTSDSRMEVQGSSAIRVWALNEAHDAVGNTLTVDYAELAQDGEYVVNAIRYAGNPGTSPPTPATNEVRFSWQARTDDFSGYVAGARVGRSKRLAAITTYAGGTTVLRYSFDYQYGEQTGRSRLAAITVCAGAGLTECFAPMSITWADRGSGYAGTATLALPDVRVDYQADSSGLRRGQLVDVNGDGLLDWVRAFMNRYGGQSRYTWVNTGDGFAYRPDHALPDVINDYQAHADGLVRGQFVDLDADGLPDWVRAFENRYGSQSRATWLNTGSGWQASTAYRLPDVITDYQAADVGLVRGQFVDLNADGRPDWVRAFTNRYGTQARQTWLNTGNGWAASSAFRLPDVIVDYTAHAEGFVRGRFVDVNGDGLTDWVRAFENASGHQSRVTWLNTGNGWRMASEYTLPDVIHDYQAANGGLLRGQFVDVNGDGLPDWVRAYRTRYGGVSQRTWLNTGAGWRHHAEYNLPDYITDYLRVDTGLRRGDFADVNGDGLPDWVRAYRDTGGNSYRNTWLNTGSGWKFASAYALNADLRSYHHWPTRIYDYGVLADMNGDGVSDFVRAYELTSGTQFKATMAARAGAPDVVTALTDSYGARIEVDYAPLSDDRVYVRDTGAERCAYPCVDVGGAVFVTAAVRNDDGAGGLIEQTYAYGGAKLDLHGRGFLGFRWIEARDERTQIYAVTDYAQTFPFIGQTLRAETYRWQSGVATRLQLSVNEWTSLSLAGGWTRFPYVHTATAYSYELNHGPGNSPVKRVTTTSEYDSYGNAVLVDVTTDDPADPAARFIRSTSSTFHNDPSAWHLGRLVCAQVTSSAPGVAAVVRTSGFEYDPVSGLLTREVIEPGSAHVDEPTGLPDCVSAAALPTPNTLTLVTDNAYDAHGNRRAVTVSGETIEARTTTTVWGERDAAGVVLAHNGRFAIAITNPAGHTELRAHDARSGAPVWLRGPNGLDTTWTQDAFGRVTGEFRADGTQTITTRANCTGAACAGRPPGAVRVVTTEVTGAPPRSVYFDRLGRERRTRTAGFDGRFVLRDTLYDADGRVTRQSLPYHDTDSPRWSWFSYDRLDRLVQTTAADGTVTQRTHDGLRVEEVSALGQRTVRVSDVVGQLRTTTQHLDDAGGAPVAVTSTFHHDAVGNLERSVDDAGNVVTMSHDLRGRKVAMTDPDMGHWTYRHDEAGQLLRQTDARGRTTVMSYDVLGRMTARTDDLDGIDEAVTAWTYDLAAHGIGRLARVDAPGYTRVHGYDSLSRPVRTDETIGAEPFTTQVEYDAAGRAHRAVYPATPQHPGGLVVQTRFTATGHAEAVSDGAGLDYWRAEAYAADGQIIRETLGNGVTTVRTVDPDNRRLQHIASGTLAAPSGVQDVGFAFDAVGNLERRWDANAGAEESFTYDALNRLTRTHLIDRVTLAPLCADEVVAYDTIGNITSRSSVGPYSYGAGGHGPHAVTTAGGTVYGYDANGNMLTRGDDTVTWAAFNKPLAITGANSTLTFRYGPERQRIQQTVTRGANDTVIKYVGSLYEKVSKPDGPDEHVHYVKAGGRAVVITTYSDSTPAKTRYLHRDHLGSVVAITDESGAVTERLAYDAWGQRRDPDTWLSAPLAILPTETRRGFTDHEHLDDMALVHMNGRIYDPGIGRFLSADPFVQFPHSTQGLNRYAYVNNNPLSYTDPSGFFIGGLLKSIFKPIKKLFSSRIGRIALAVGAAWVSGGATIAALTNGYWSLAAAKAAGVSVGIGTAAASGAVAGFTGSLVSSGSLKSALRGAVFGAISAGTFSELGNFIRAEGLSSIEAAGLHGLAGGTINALGGGDFLSGFASSGFAKLAAGGLQGATRGAPLAGTITSALIGGTARVLGGGKFLNGAASAAFAYFFNQLGSKKGEMFTHLGGGRYLNNMDGTVQYFGVSAEGYLAREAGSSSIVDYETIDESEFARAGMALSIGSAIFGGATILLPASAQALATTFGVYSVALGIAGVFAAPTDAGLTSLGFNGAGFALSSVPLPPRIRMAGEGYLFLIGAGYTAKDISTQPHHDRQ